MKPATRRTTAAPGKTPNPSITRRDAATVVDQMRIERRPRLVARREEPSFGTPHSSGRLARVRLSPSDRAGPAGRPLPATGGAATLWPREGEIASLLENLDEILEVSR